MKRPITFEVEKESDGSLARAGLISTPHGDILTPAFTAVATRATVKATTPDQLHKIGLQTLIANTYHLYLSPGEKTIEKAGGVGKFMGWEGPTMTDSGGFQVFSLGVGFGKKISKISAADVPREAGVVVFDEDVATEHGKLAVVDDEGVTFTSHLDGSLHRFTPERSIEIQHALGADIIFAFDEFLPPLDPHADQRESMNRTHRWAERSLKAHRGNIVKNDSQGIFGIVQGGRYSDLRAESAQALAEMDFDGYGIGGSFNKADILGLLDTVNGILPKEKPRHLLGIGEPEDIFFGVAAGIDTFDCVLPTRNGRTGGIYTSRGKIQIPNAEYKEDFGLLDPECVAPGFEKYTRAYVHHLFRTHEMLGAALASLHNLHFLVTLSKQIRESILEGRFEEFKTSFLAKYQA